MTWIENKPIIALAPMADYTDQPFCKLCREVESKKYKVKSDERFVIFREMVSAEAIVRENKKTLRMCEFDEMERPLVLQLFGADPKTIEQAAKILVERFRPDGIDINMGCPVPKITKKGHAGADLMKDHDRAVAIVKALKNANLGIPVSVKTRLGWSKEDEILEFAPKLEAAGVDAITIHGRTTVQGYSGKANWEMVRKIKTKMKIPVIANGDIKTAEDVERCLEATGADGVMIGRGALGSPWIFNHIQNTKGYGTTKYEIPIDEIIRVMLRHVELQLDYYGERGIIGLRKHLPFYFKGMKGIRDLRSKLVRVSSLEELKKILQKIPR